MRENSRVDRGQQPRAHQVRAGSSPPVDAFQLAASDAAADPRYVNTGMPPTRYRLNVVGDFYVTAGCCTFCGVPAAHAPDLFETDTRGEQCFVKKQPRSDDELRRMIEVLASQELGCVRYAGRDASTLRRIVAANEAASCDALASSLGRLRAWLMLRRR